MNSCKEAPDPIFVFRGAKSPVMSVTFLKSPEDGLIHYLAAGTQEGQVLVWDLKTKCLFRDWIAYPDCSVLWIYSRQPGEIWTLGRHNSVKSWNISQPVPETVKQYLLHDYLGFSHCDIYNGDDALLAIPGPSENSVTVFDIEKDSKVCILTASMSPKKGNVMQIKWTCAYKKVLVIIMYESGHISLWDYKTTSVVSEIQCRETPICLSVNTTSSVILVGSTAEKLFTFFINDNLQIIADKEVEITNPGTSCCTARPDDKIFVTGGWDFRVRVYSSKKMKPLAVLFYHKKTVECLTYASDYVKEFDSRFLLAAGSSDKSISLWKLFE
ncbi:guanine nucleotide-binding protein subunit beta-like protein 1 [Palaemon carinicauda]|uniref:guanine nucleotide-binding protein subunit beta-like protein 1 n=1 Tax=Palaemon carinicauda TaxID=392227 RepID=UPI0035B5BB99